MTPTISYLIIALMYGVGFLFPMLRIHSRRDWWISLLAHIVFVCAIIALAGTGGFFVLMALSIPVFVYVIGAVAGHITRSVLLLTKKRVFSLGGLVAACLGLAIPPAALAAHWSYKNWQAEKAYARLPDAATLPDIAACSGFRNIGKLLDRTLILPHQGEQSGIPSRSVSIRYPIQFESFPSKHPKPGVKVEVARFQMHSDDATPVTEQDKRDSQGKVIPLMERRPLTTFNFSTGWPTARTANRLLNSLQGNFSSLNAPPDLELVPSTVPGLQRFINQNRMDRSLWSTSYIAMNNGEITELIQCASKDRYPNPGCSFRFDVATVSIEGTFRPANIANWPKTRSQLEAFAECSIAAAQPQ
ncbi:hypothetical protein RMS29_002165 [Agrobacterium rosae]|uniref:Uncharacterized protein n=1 Tax=Agrobacterium rosae TaxID=1972867 RepID=A0AAE5RTX0_9HYPH|nr:hypothetical protein [Agrobacterium rosae]KAA3514051.1 hypothetical protein DXM21_04210 [Agrobacterium rosae]KAA3522718.1 hypothetical protein DXM25_04210 [Agrobacterium rosae]MCM2434021.1 hypothetical protein [Agrobacterium rosae]MDX8330420.1 hypothetical protein [Agrobacterium rosae]MQB47381.1 hypothetical protein [Agrobacterium rosae]